MTGVGPWRRARDADANGALVLTRAAEGGQQVHADFDSAGSRRRERTPAPTARIGLAGQAQRRTRRTRVRRDTVLTYCTGIG